MPGLLLYIDPASGTLLLQAIVAGVIGSVAFFRHSIWSFVRRIGGRSDKDDPPPQEAPDGPS